MAKNVPTQEQFKSVATLQTYAEKRFPYSDKLDIIAQTCAATARCTDFQVTLDQWKISISKFTEAICSNDYYGSDNREAQLRFLQKANDLAQTFCGDQIEIDYGRPNLIRVGRLLAQDHYGDLDKITRFLLHWCKEKQREQNCPTIVTLMASPSSKRELTLNLTLAVQFAIQAAIVDEAYSRVDEFYGAFCAAVDQCQDNDVQICEKLIRTQEHHVKHLKEFKICNKILGVGFSLKKFAKGLWHEFRSNRSYKQHLSTIKQVKQLYYESETVKEALTQGHSLRNLLLVLQSEMRKLCDLRNAVYSMPIVQLADACLPDLNGVTASLGYGAAVNITNRNDWKSILFDRHEPFLTAANDLAAAIAAICG